MAEEEAQTPSTEQQPRSARRTTSARAEGAEAPQVTEGGYVENEWNGQPHLTCPKCGWGTLRGPNDEGVPAIETHMFRYHRIGRDPEAPQGTVLFDERGNRVSG